MSIISQSDLCLDVAKLFPRKGQWSETEYLLLETNRLVELSDGSIEVLEMPTEGHQDMVLFLYRQLFNFSEPVSLGKVQTAPRPMRLWSGKMREPDIMFMLTQHSERRSKQFWNGADLVMEVVSEDRDHDLVKKRAEYAQCGISEYWTIDPLLDEITILKLVGEVYQIAGVYYPGANAQSVLLPGFIVDVKAVFDLK